MRSTLALAIVSVLVAGVAGAEDSSPESCRAITDSLLRLRCFDEATKQRSTPTPVKAPEFAIFAVPVYRGPTARPDFARDRAHAQFRTRIRDGVAGGVNFAGEMAVIEIGCGAGCRIVPVVNLRTAKIYDFPLGGEDNMYLDLKYQPGSRLIIGQWETDRCMREAFIWTGQAFESRGKTDLGPSEKCRM